MRVYFDARVLVSLIIRDAFTDRAEAIVETGEVTPCRRPDLTLRTPDALQLALAARSGASLATFDRGMADCASVLGIALADL